MTDRPVTVRPATIDDAERIAALFTDEGYPAAGSTIAARIERFEAGNGHVLVAEDAGELLGFVALHLMPRFEHDDTIGRVPASPPSDGVAGAPRSAMGAAARRLVARRRDLP